MAQIQNISGEARDVPGLGLIVEAGQIVDVPDDDVYAYTQQAGMWAPIGDAQGIHDAQVEAYEQLAAAEATTNPTPPARNASREEWATYVIAADLANPEDLEGLGRNEIRDTYGPQES